MLRSKVLILLAAAALAVSACGDDDDGGSGGGDTVSANEYAAAICTAFLGWRDAIQKRQTDLQSGLKPGISPEEGRDVLEDFLGDAVTASDKLVEEVDAAGIPDADGGEEVANALSEAAQQAQSNLAEARDDVADLPTDSPTAFGEAASQFGDDIRSALEGVAQGLEDVESPDLDKAFEEEEACQG